MKDNTPRAGEQARTAILFVCLGNICRSPLAEGIFRAVVSERGLEHAFHLDSAGTGAWHAGSPPDPRSVATARRFGLDISGQRARQVEPEDFSRFDIILAMDRANVGALRQRAPKEAHGRIHLFLDYALGGPEEIPDPYYGGDDGFAAVYRTLREASDALVARLAERDGSARISGQASSTI
ncbi:low molecular weight protein-tyrosine-phosphatase [Chelativorans xinjiangense]|uniref:low molecular weight protein-tyrosine-phosphatase n=1 Tax=Chelativorans xinjiangense TaxID=2681485 RepID=UPI001358B8AD|nr:low molecular weight protein-tyrosine-phosphatase [Chelativorans xinjiangense]